MRNGSGTPGVQKMWPQYALLPLTFVMINVNTASVNVTAIFPVRFPAPGSNPNKISKKNKKEKCQHVRQKLFVMMTNVWLHDFIANKNNDRFEERLDALMAPFLYFSRILLLPPRRQTATKLH